MHIIGISALLLHASEVLFLALSLIFFCLFACVRNIPGTAERICAKFTRKTCLIPCSDEFECQGQRSMSRGQNRENCRGVIHIDNALRGVCRTLQMTCRRRRDHSVAIERWRGDGSARWLELLAACVQCMFSKNIFSSSVRCICM